MATISSQRRCPNCGKAVSGRDPANDKDPFPFCSDRCKVVDLGRWLSESYRIPGPTPGDDAPAPAPAADDGDDPS